jgi:hypothetical protein
MNDKPDRLPLDTMRTARSVARIYHLQGDELDRFMAAAAMYLLCGARRTTRVFDLETGVLHTQRSIGP